MCKRYRARKAGRWMRRSRLRAPAGPASTYWSEAAATVPGGGRSWFARAGRAKADSLCGPSGGNGMQMGLLQRTQGGGDELSRRALAPSTAGDRS